MLWIIHFYIRHCWLLNIFTWSDSSHGHINLVTHTHKLLGSILTEIYPNIIIIIPQLNVNNKAVLI